MAWLLMRIVAMPTKRGQRSRAVREHPGRYDKLDYDNDNDNSVFVSTVISGKGSTDG
jgi:hypothetical protein